MKHVYLITILFITACTNNSTSTPKNKALSTQHTDAVQTTIDPKNYLQYCSSFKKVPTAQTKISILMDSIFPCWVGTPWNFYGTTTTPQQGTIACGYFVTTILRDIGVPVQRVKHAEVASSVMIKAVCGTANWITTKAAIENYIQQLPNNSLCIIGLDFHTGFVVKRNNKVYFVNSSYITPAQVKIENWQDAVPVQTSKVWVIGPVKI